MSDELDDIQAIFFEECEEGLAVAEQGLGAMLAGHCGADVIANVFRAVHSIKGGSGAFGHADLLAFSHSFENVLDAVRAGTIAPTPTVNRALMAAFDILSDHVAAARGLADRPDDAAVLAQLDAILADKGDDLAPAPDLAAPELAAAAPAADAFGFEPVAMGLEDLDFDAPAPVTPAAPDWLLAYAPGAGALANGGEPLLVLREIARLGGAVVAADLDRLPPLRELGPEQAYLGWRMTVPGSVERTAIEDCFEFVTAECSVGIARAAPASAAPAAAAPARMAGPAPVTSPAAEPHHGDPAAQSIRVDLGKLDMLLNLVGELVIHNSILSDRLAPPEQERVELPELARLTREIQHNVMSLRAQPIRQAFSRVPRMLRDLGQATAKQVELVVSGEGTEIDKGVIEKIGDPLTHMIRNAVDHGIETPAERLAAGKPAQGTIHLSAEQKGARIFVRVTDDGRGIDRVRVRAKAVERGIIAADAELTEEELDQLICAPGFSTAEAVSNISGRGVGMDVVRSNVEALGGRVDIASQPGQGTSITMVLPLTLAILDGMIVRLCDQRFVLPLANVIETVKPEPGQVRPLTPNSEVIELRGAYLPVRRLTQFFDLDYVERRESRPQGGDRGQRSAEDSLVIIVESDKAGHVGLMVDTIDDRREVVIKSLDQNLHPIRGLNGATILGDGSIALILDIDALVAAPGGRVPQKALAA